MDGYISSQLALPRVLRTTCPNDGAVQNSTAYRVVFKCLIKGCDHDV
jgi:hypothetical protein